MACQRIVLLLALLAWLTACSAAGQSRPEQGDSPGPVASPLPVIAQTDGRTRQPVADLCPRLAAPVVTHLKVLQTPDLPEPPARAPFMDPVFGTCVVRVTDRSADLAAEDPSPGLKNEYARIQAFNADESLLLARGIEATWYVYDAETLRPLARLPFDGPVEPRWDADDPFRLFFTDETRLMTYNLRAGGEALVHDFARDVPGVTLTAVGMRYEGSPSMDGRYWGLMAQDQEGQAVALLVHDREQDQLIARRTLYNAPELDSVTISPLGDYFLAFHDYCASGLGTVERPCGLMVYDRELESGRGLLRIVGHSDLALDAEGREVLVYQDIDTDHIAMLDLASGEVTPLWPIDFSHSAIGLHFSGRAFERPGWALVSTYNGGHPQDRTWMDDQVFAVELKAGGRVARLAHSHSLVDEEQEHDYWAEPQATVNRDFSRVLFTSNWGRSGTPQVEIHLILLPEDWLPPG